MKIIRIGLASAIVPVLLLAGISLSHAARIDPFVGEYVGHSFEDLESGVSKRDFDVRVVPADDGFSVSWTTFIHTDDGSVKKKSSSIEFRKTEKDGVFVAQQKKNLFGSMVPYDPMGEEPYVWARIDGETLSVIGFRVMENGTYEIQTYRRTLTETGLNLVFTREHENGMVRRVVGELKRVRN